MIPRPIAVTLVALLATALPAPATAGPPAEPAGATLFDTQVRPIIEAHCVKCHGGAKVKSGLMLSTREAILKGGERGPAISLDNPDESLLLQAVNQEDELKMPPGGKLPQSQIDILSRWVKLGAPWPEGVTVAGRPGPPPVDEHARNFWSFRPVVRPELPAVQHSEWVRTPVDAFVLARLESAGLQPAPPAEKTSLLRRVSYDLIGLPPTPEEVDDFLADDSPRAYEKVVDRLLASPRYGERWGRHWLDLVRYAETDSFEFDAPKPLVWRYRDYVIKSFNEDKPYDRFIQEQIAGDELEPMTAEGLTATGYYRLGPWDGGAPDRLQAAYDELDDIVATTGQVFLGLTVNCARCHDHKIDPFPAADYYRLLSFFHGIKRYGPRGSLRPDPGQDGPPNEGVARYRKEQAALKGELKAIEDALLTHLEAGERDDFMYEPNRAEILRKHTPQDVTQEDYARYQSSLRDLAALDEARPEVLCVTENGHTPPETHVLLRGNPRTLGDRVEPGFPSVINAQAPSIPEPGDDAATSSRRRVLAAWIASADNPLTARVMVNRIWQYHFGRAIVRTSSDFGYGGSPPTHPELLDWLADAFVARGWKPKAMHRLIVTSSTYRMSSTPDANALARDPENDAFWRFDQRRLSAEEVRDSILAVSGNLNLSRIGGPSIYPRIQREVLSGQSRPGAGWGQSSPEEQARRSVYIHTKRSLIVPLLAVFDAADADASCALRFTTTQPTQALAMLNGDFLQEQAQIFAQDARRLAGDDPAAQVRLVLRRVTQREPSAREVERGVEFMAKLRGKHQLTPPEALRGFCLLALNLNEFVYLD
jgi:mono/diheme cytochrome c family protein